jgi:hypothetical protein
MGSRSAASIDAHSAGYSTFALASRSYFSSVRSSTIPFRNRMWPLMVLLPASTWPMKTTLTCFLTLGATADGSAGCQNVSHKNKREMLLLPNNALALPATTTSSSSSRPERSSEFRFKCEVGTTTSPSSSFTSVFLGALAGADAAVAAAGFGDAFSTAAAGGAAGAAAGAPNVGTNSLAPKFGFHSVADAAKLAKGFGLGAPTGSIGLSSQESDISIGDLHISLVRLALIKLHGLCNCIPQVHHRSSCISIISSSISSS